MFLSSWLNWPNWPFCLVPLYLAYCSFFRFSRRNKKHALFPYPTRESFAKMTSEDAFQIVQYITTLEFPDLCEKALEFALFR